MTRAPRTLDPRTDLVGATAGDPAVRRRAPGIVSAGRAGRFLARVGAAFRSTVVSLVRSGPLTLASIVCAAVALSLVGAALVVSRGVDNATIRWRGGVETIVFMDPTASKDAIDAVGRELSGDARVAQATYVSQHDAYNEFVVMFHNSPDLISSVGPEALPSSWRVVPAAGVSEAAIEALGDGFKSRSDVYDVVYAKDAVASVLSVSELVRKLLLGLAVALIGVQLLLVFSSARAAVYARRDELAIMRSVGAPRWLIRVPFLAEGALCGALGGVIAAGVTWAGVRVIEDRVGNGTSLAILAHFNVDDAHVRAVGVLLVAGGALLGVVASAAATARYIRVGDGRAATLHGRLREGVARRRVRRRVAEHPAG